MRLNIVLRTLPIVNFKRKTPSQIFTFWPKIVTFGVYTLKV